MEPALPTHPRVTSATRAKWLAGLFLILVFVLMAIELYRGYTQAELAAQHRASTQSELLAERLTSGLREASLALDNLDSNAIVLKTFRTGLTDPTDHYRLRALLDKTIQDLPYLTNIRLFDTSCELLFSTPDSKRLSLANDMYCRWLHRKISSEDSHGERYLASIQNAESPPGITVASRLYDQNGTLLGLAVGLIAPEILMGEVVVDQHSEILIMDGYHSLIVRWNTIPAVQAALFTNPEQSEKIFVHEPNYLLFSGPSAIDGIKRIYGLRSAGDYPIQIAVGIATSDYTTEWQERIIIYLLAWSWLAIVTFITLRGYLSNLTRNAVLLATSRKIQESEEQARLVLDTAPIALLMVDNEKGVILYANTHAINMLCLPDNVNDRSVTDDTLPSVPLRAKPLDIWLRAGENIQAKEVEIEREDNSRVWVVTTMKTTHFREHPATLIGLYDISARKALEQEIERKNQLLSEMVVTDPLTHLYNRRFADQTLSDEILRCERYGHPMTIASFDIDHFKKFNDRYGHQAGDDVLVTVANELKELTRSTDICARTGGEEFLVIFPCTRLKDAYKVMDRIRSKLERTPLSFTQEHITFSGGVTDWRPGDSANAMQIRADKLLYQAKANGRNQLCVEEEAH